MVHHVVTGVPQAEGGERVQKGVTANPFVEFTVWREALMASIMANDEQAANHKASGHAAQKFEPNRFKENRAGDQAHEQGGVHNQQKNGAQSGAVRQWRQPLANDFAMRHGLVQGDRLQIVRFRVSGHSEDAKNARMQGMCAINFNSPSLNPEAFPMHDMGQ